MALSGLFGFENIVFAWIILPTQYFEAVSKLFLVSDVVVRDEGKERGDSKASIEIALCLDQ